MIENLNRTYQEMVFLVIRVNSKDYTCNSLAFMKLHEDIYKSISMNTLYIWT